ncbi:hypothetical protein BH20ACT16_BH20ACT16_03250 [soil metagenome]
MPLRKITWQHWNNPYATHQPVSYAVAQRCNGPVVEFGCGEGSTRLLHSVCAERGVKLLTLDSDAEWLGRYSRALAGEQHEFRIVESWSDELAEIERHEWGLVFIDQGSWEARAETARRLAGKAEYLIVHDHDALSDLGLLGSKIRPIAGPHDLGSRDFGDIFSSWREFFPNAPWPYPPTGPPTLLASNRHDVTDISVNFSEHVPPVALQRAERLAHAVARPCLRAAKSAVGKVRA